MLALLAACNRASPTAPPVPEAIHVNPLDPDANPLPPVLPPVLPVPTWTMPAGDSVALPVGTSVAPAQVPPVEAAGTPPGIPFPSPQPARTVAPDGPPATDPEIEALVAAVQPARLTGDIRQLVGFGTRHALSSADDRRRGVGAARNWLAAGFSRLGGGSAGRQVLVEFEDFALDFAGRKTTQRNVVATLPGIGKPKRLVYLTAHYDSRIQDVTNGNADAPGADDNASGVATLMELARLMSRRQWDATVRFVAFAAEEPGLKGSRYHAPAAAKLGLPLLAVFNNDIVGGSKAGDGSADAGHVRVFSADPDDGPSRRLARYAHVIGQRYGMLEVVVVPRADRADRGGDHQPFSEAGFAAVRITAAAEDTGRQHTPQDTMDRLDPAYHAAVTRLNLALAANLVLAPPGTTAPPRLAVAADRPGALRITWTPVDDPRVAGYWVAVRGAGEPAYRSLDWVPGASTSAYELAGVGPSEKVAIAVAAADDRGHMSLFGPEVSR